MIRRLTFVLLLALLPFVGWAQRKQNKNYYGQHISIKQTTGDSIQYDIKLCHNGFRPVVKDGKVQWTFMGNTEVSKDYNDPYKGDFTIDKVKSIDFRSFEYDEREARKALIEFYHAMDGDNWLHHENWCSDKPIWEWFGINGCDEYNKGHDWYPWVDQIWFGGYAGNITTPHELPDCFQRMGPIQYIGFPQNNIIGELPSSWGNIYSLETISLFKNKLGGTIPDSYKNLPRIYSIDLALCELEGPFPEDFVLSFVNRNEVISNNLIITGNNYSGKVPKSIQEHPRFCSFWPTTIIQNTPMDVSDVILPAPKIKTKDSEGNLIDFADIYKNNKYTLLYKWGVWCEPSKAFNKILVPVYKAYKDKGLEVIGIHYDPEYDDKMKEYVKENDIPWTNILHNDWEYSDNGWKNEEAEIFYWTSPNIFLVDKNGVIVFNSLMDKQGNNQIGNGDYLNELFPYLEKLLGPIDYNFYTSTDYSQDGKVVTLQESSTGQGVDLVFVGEGFTDKDIEEGGRFDQRMNEALEQFFAYEPYTSLRNRFNVYAVKTVSPNEEFYGANAKHAIDEDLSKALEYASKVTTLKPDRPMRVAVIYNNPSGGRSYCTMMEDDSFVCFAMDGVSTVLNHEAGGHGIGKLLDEYVEPSNETETLPEESKVWLDNVWTALGWGANVDWRSNPTEVKWAKFISDERYADEKIGIYAGGYLYHYGAYRPTENSMMRYNDTPFNAPSREEIYKRVMKESEGDGWTYDYETFVAFDTGGNSQGHSRFVDALTNASRRTPKTGEQQQIRTAPPVFVKGTWRDALKNKK